MKSERMKIDVCSDIHVDQVPGSYGMSIKQYLTTLLPDKPNDVLVIAGDVADSIDKAEEALGFLSKQYKKVYYTWGNHDLALNGQDDKVKFKRDSFYKVECLKDKVEKLGNVHLLNGNVFEYEGKKIGGSGLWYDGSYSIKHFSCNQYFLNNQYRYWYDGPRVFVDGNVLRVYDQLMPSETIKAQAIIDQDVDLMVSHIGPLAYQIKECYHNTFTGFFYFDGEYLLDQMKKGSVWLFGHTHDPYDFDYDGIRLVCNPIGYEYERNQPRIISLDI